MWEDQVIAICSLIFALSAIPIVQENYKLKSCSIPYKSSVVTALSLYIVSAAYLSLGIYFSVLAITTTGIVWSVIAYQRWLYGRRREILDVRGHEKKGW